MSGPFTLQLRAIAERTKDKANLVCRKLLFDVSTSLVMKSPVGDATYWVNKPPPGYVGGRFRANWQFATGRIDQTTTETTDKSGSATEARLHAEVPENAAGVFFITNSLPYAKRIEDGWSRRQAPAGVVGLTWVEWRDYLNRIIVELR